MPGPTEIPRRQEGGSRLFRSLRDRFCSPRRRAFAPTVSPLEGRALRSDLSAVQPSAEEQYMLQLMNRARANPAMTPGAATTGNPAVARPG